MSVAPIVGMLAETIDNGLACLTCSFPVGGSEERYQTVSKGGLKIAIASEGAGLTRCGDVGEVHFDRQSAYIFRQPFGTKTVTEDLLFTNGWIRLFGIEIKQDWVQQQHRLSGDDPFLDWAFEALDRDFCSSFQSTVAYRRIAEEARCCPYVGAMRRLFLESRILELVVLASEADTGAVSKVEIQSSDAAKLDEVKNIIIDDVSAPLSIADLAGAVGLNVMKLKKGFKARFGQTVRQYVIDRRLEEAHALLSDSDLQIAQVAYRVGYTPAHFTHAFRTRFSISPTEARRRNR